MRSFGFFSLALVLQHFLGDDGPWFWIVGVVVGQIGVGIVFNVGKSRFAEVEIVVIW